MTGITKEGVYNGIGTGITRGFLFRLGIWLITTCLAFANVLFLEYWNLTMMAEGPGFEPGTPISQGNRLAGGRTRPLCDPSTSHKYLLYQFINKDSIKTLPIGLTILSLKSLKFSLSVFFFYVIIGTYGNKRFGR